MVFGTSIPKNLECKGHCRRAVKRNSLCLENKKAGRKFAAKHFWSTPILPGKRRMRRLNSRAHSVLMGFSTQPFLKNVVQVQIVCHASGTAMRCAPCISQNKCAARQSLQTCQCSLHGRCRKQSYLRRQREVVQSKVSNRNVDNIAYHRYNSRVFGMFHQA